MRDPSRLSVSPRDSGIVETKTSHVAASLRATSHGVSNEAKKILVYERTQSESWKDPTKQKRRFLRTKGKNESLLSNPEKWTFSRSEGYAALDRHIHNLGPVGIARAILDLNSTDDDVNVKYPCETKREYEGNDGLENVAAKGSLDYVAVLASCGTRHSAKDNTLLISLEREDMPIQTMALKKSTSFPPWSKGTLSWPRCSYPHRIC